MAKTMKIMVFIESGEFKPRRIPLAHLTKIETLQKVEEKAYYLQLYAEGQVFTTKKVTILETEIQSL